MGDTDRETAESQMVKCLEGPGRAPASVQSTTENTARFEGEK